MQQCAHTHVLKVKGTGRYGYSGKVHHLVNIERGLEKMLKDALMSR